MEGRFKDSLIAVKFLNHKNNLAFGMTIFLVVLGMTIKTLQTTLSL